MASVIRGTTPTIIYTMKTVPVSDITVAVLTIKSEGEVVVRKELSEATVGEDTLSWKLTQEETLLFGVNQKARMMINYKLADGTRGASNETDLCFVQNHVEGVI